MKNKGQMIFIIIIASQLVNGFMDGESVFDFGPSLIMLIISFAIFKVFTSQSPKIKYKINTDDSSNNLCPNCNMEFSAHLTECPHCITVSKNRVECDFCGAMNDLAESRCTTCNALIH